MLDKIKMNAKHRTIMKDYSKTVEFFEGVTGSSKSMIAGVKFLFRIMESHHTQFFLVGESASAVERNFVQNPMSFINLFDDICKYKKSGTGSSRVEITMEDNSIKTVYVVGYDKRNSWKKILGSTSGGYLVDEINIASEEFIGELFTRLARDRSFLLCTSNGDDDDLMVYQRYLNKAYPHPDFITEIPASTLKDLNEHPEKNEDYIYYFFSFKDNPTFTEKDIQDLLSVHPPGSWQHRTKILGIRGTLEGAVYAEFIKDKHTVSYDKIVQQAFNIPHLEVGVDIGASAETVFSITAYTNNWARMIVLDSYILEGRPDADGIAEQLNKWLLPYYKIFGLKIKKVNVDNAEPFIIRTIKNNIAYPIDVKPSKKPPIIERIALLLQMLYKDRLLFADTKGAQEMKRMLLKIKSDGHGGYLDEEKIWNDYQDAFFYSFTKNMIKLSKYITDAHQMSSTY